MDKQINKPENTGISKEAMKELYSITDDFGRNINSCFKISNGPLYKNTQFGREVVHSEVSSYEGSYSVADIIAFKRADGRLDLRMNIFLDPLIHEASKDIGNKPSLEKITFDKVKKLFPEDSIKNNPQINKCSASIHYNHGVVYESTISND